MVDRLLLDIADDGMLSVSMWPAGELPQPVGEPAPLVLPLDRDSLEDLRWYLEDYLRHPYAGYADRGSGIAARLPAWGEGLFHAVFGTPETRAAYAAVRARGDHAEVVIRSASTQSLGLPWELMRDPSRRRPIVLDGVSVTRSLPVQDLSGSFPAAEGRLRVLMVISRPEGRDDVGYGLIARPLLGMLDAVRGNVELVVLRPPTLEHLRRVLIEEPFQVVHFDGHGAAYGGVVFEQEGGGADPVPAEKVARVLAEGRVPVVVLNACRSAQVAAHLVRGGAASVVAMAYSVYAVAAAEFMAAFYERLFAGDRVADAVTAGRARLALRDGRPSPKGRLPLEDWVVPVHYLRRDLGFPGLRTERRGASLDDLLDRPPDEPPSDDDLAPVGVFVGRDDLFHTLESAARLQRVVILHGSGGAGKTELAKAFGRWWRDTGGVERPDWVIWHSFEPGVASFGLSGVIDGIGLRVFGTDFARRDPAQRLAVVRRLLRERRLLLIWDDFESVHTMPDPVTPPLSATELDELKRFLGEAGTVLIVSRNPEEWLGDLRRVEVDGLSADEAVLYADQLLEPFPEAGRRRASPAFAELMEWLDGHPLSMRLILPHLATTGPAALLAALRGAAPLPGRDDGDRRSSLTASIGYSFDRLPEADRRALTMVALFHGVVDANLLAWLSGISDVLQRVRGLTADDWTRVLDGAAAVGLLTRFADGMYRIHPALPAFLAQRWRAEDSFAAEHAAAAGAMLQTCSALADFLLPQLSGRSAKAGVLLTRLHARNLTGMLAHAIEEKIWDRAQCIVQTLVEYWDIRGLSEETRGWTDRMRLALEGADGSPPGLDSDAGRCWAFVASAEATRSVLDERIGQAQERYTAILEHLERQPPGPYRQRLLSGVYHQLGVVAGERERWEEAERWHRTSLAMHEECGDRAGLAGCYHQLGRCAQEQRRWKEAGRWFRKALAVEEELGDQARMADGFHQLGMIAQERRRWHEAERWYHRSLALNEDVGNRPHAAITYHQLGLLAQERQHWAEAERWYLAALEVNEELNRGGHLVANYHQLGVMAVQLGRPREAEQWFTRALALAQSLDLRTDIDRERGSLDTLRRS
ncbi:tetratricopeptide repeat protein [Nonomuraea gerenzanensis]|uniref:TPR repeat:TPR repeat n=1 Tax=Nonomuraea gerenzanensis TaxID=93944 RepID=A0A1M4E1U0_9ACTN|nr:tetratricopeptide repeat protein [Nonomuraea gerenzanensis]UBU15048.1 tetratricopeptide repeat protein [Nonomuraea gerenzanensis]SBO92791.1 TPR repeat:TPR repeat [Nonomuraea gerenzanensis]